MNDTPYIHEFSKKNNSYETFKTHLLNVGLEFGDGCLDKLLLEARNLADGVDLLDTLRLK